MAELLLGPMLRYVDDTSATVWVEADSPCEVGILGATTRTFQIHGHHYALLVIEDLPSGSTLAYEVELDGRRAWPLAGSTLPASVIRTLRADQPVRVLFGSCRAAGPHQPRVSQQAGTSRPVHGADALRAHGLRMLAATPEDWPDLLVLLGDQVYADEPSPGAQARIGRRARSRGKTPPGVVAGFEEYTWLYHESWQPEIERWIFSVVPSAMIFDDHDVIDDWNISDSWVRDIRQQPWWEEHIVGALISYWVYQHLGNLSPAELRREGMVEAVTAAGDAGPLLTDWAHASEAFTPTPGGYRFSYARDLGPTRLVVVDCRNGRVLDPDVRSMVDDDEWNWIVDQSRQPTRDLIIATSLPVFVPPALHDLQVWNEEVCNGAWGRLAAWFGERVRRGLDLEDWAAFGRSFEAMTELLTDIAVGVLDPGGRPPRTISIISGDIHFSYRAEVHFPDDSQPCSKVHQVVSSPIRNALGRRDRWVIRAAASNLGKVAGAAFARLVRRQRPHVSWDVDDGPYFSNAMAVLLFDQDHVRLVVEQARPTAQGGTNLVAADDTVLWAKPRGRDAQPDDSIEHPKASMGATC